MISTVELLKSLTLQREALVAASRFSGLPKLEDKIEPWHATALALCDLLSSMGLEKDHQYSILDVTKDDIKTYVNSPQDKLLSIQILDNTYVALPGWLKAYNFMTMEYIDSLPQPPLISIAISVTSILDRIIKAMI